MQRPSPGQRAPPSRGNNPDSPSLAVLSERAWVPGGVAVRALRIPRPTPPTTLLSALFFKKSYDIDT